MDFRDSLSAQLPRPRPDEPARLRQDILDELNDHLVCSYHREILRGADSSVARHQVLEHFGDPAAVACRLWLDAMRGKIMAQRVLVGSSVLATVVCLALVGLLWQQSIQAQRIAAEQVALAHASAAEAAVREREMLKRLQQMTEAIKHPRSPDWNQVRVSVREESAQGAPLAGASLNLWGEQIPNPVLRETNQAGVAEFGLLHPGVCWCGITRNRADGKLTASVNIDIQPDEAVDKLIVCPSSKATNVGVRLRCPWPADLETEALVLAMTLRFCYLETADGTRWMPSESLPSWPFQSVILGPSDAITTFKPIGAEPRVDAIGHREGAFLDLREDRLDGPAPRGSPALLQVGNYGLVGLAVWRRVPDVQPGRRRFELVAGARPPARRQGQRDSAAGSLDSSGNPKSPRAKEEGPSIIEPPPEYWERADASFVARLGQASEWTIPLPDELIQAVRIALKAEKKPKDKPASKPEANKENG